MANRLQHETSPYLLQHAHNPVDWYPWGEEALAAARAQDKPILLSIGYSTCHWCHVMERESFEDPAIANLMNQHFINIKVDREERPDLDAIYMAAVQMMTGQGGWPLTVFLTPDGRPFYGGTYFPPEDRHRLPGFPRVLLAAAEAYRNRRADVELSADQIRAQLAEHFRWSLPEAEITPALLDEAASGLARQFDQTNGGFGSAPKFPPAMALEFLLRYHLRSGSATARRMVELTLEKMARGGIHDQIGGGFHRYAVDEVWLVPHFEKMLYDNALLARLYVLAYQVTGHAFYAAIALDTFNYVLREMTSREGGFYAAQDADSEGEEGRFYVWTPEELEAVLGPETAAVVARYYGVRPGGNFEGKSILHALEDPVRVAAVFDLDVEELAALIGRARETLYAARAQRVWPHRDEKILTAWNGLMLRALAQGAVVLDRDDLREAAVRNATFLRTHLYRDGRLLHTYKDGVAKIPGYLEDYAALIAGLLALYEATFDAAWIAWARELADRALSDFWDSERGAFFDTPADAAPLVARPMDAFDSATPSGNALLAESLLRLALLLGEDTYRQRAMAVLARFAPLAAKAPTGFGQLLCAADLALAATREVALVGDPQAPGMDALLDIARRPYLPHQVVALRHPDRPDEEEIIPLLRGRTAIDGRPTAYVCEGFACRQPATTAAELAEQLGVVR
ncbi:MAG: thioredoxin domain-containing protein [Sphaerobacter sp.]|nr:thioredoxin domain-containing protein [Sphaerobacter sp.]